MERPTTGRPVDAEMAATLTAIMSAHLSDQEIGIDDDFYAMGGDSLIALQVVTDAQDHGISITLRDLLYHPTVRDLLTTVPPGPTASGSDPGNAAADGAVLVDTAPLPAADRALLPPGVASADPATELQLAMIFLAERSGDPDLYHAFLGWQVRAEFDESRFRAALVALSDRHPALRASFDLGGFSQPIQLVWSAVPVPLTVEARPGAGPADARAAARRWRVERLELPIDWSRAPLWRCHVVVGEGLFDVTLAVHHSIVDGWSYGRLVVDLLRLYQAGNGDAGLPAVPEGVHRRFLAAERAAVASEQAARYWCEQASGVPQLERTRGSAPADARERRALELPAQVVPHLRGVARRTGLPLKSLGLAAHVWALSGLRADNAVAPGDVTTGVVVDARPEIPGVDLVVGPYLNTVPLRVRATGGSWAALARRAFEAERAGSAYRAYPLAALETRLGHPPFDAVFNFTQFRIHRDASEVPGLAVGSWWIEGKPSFGFRVDFDVDVTEAGSRVGVAFDPALLTAVRAEEHLVLLHRALTLLAADPDAPVPLPDAHAAGTSQEV